MSARRDPQEKWRLAVYGAGRPLYAEGNQLWAREYAVRSSANRAAASVRKMHPGSVGELSRFVLRAGALGTWWTCFGGRDVDVFVLWDDREEVAT